MWPLSGKEIFEMIHNVSCTNVLFDDIVIEKIALDSRDIVDHPPQQLLKKTLASMFVAIQGEKFDGHEFLKYVFDKGIPLALVNRHSSHLHSLSKEYLQRCLLVDDVILALRTLAQKFRKSFSFPVVAIGGSNGKTTTKEILASFLSFDARKITKTQKSENGFLGIALTILQKAHTKLNPPDALVLEIGIDAIGAMEKHVQISQPNVVLLTALGPEHLTGLKNWDTAAKEELILFTAPNAKRIWQLSDQKICEHFLNTKEHVNFLATHLNDIFVIEKEDYLVHQARFQNLNVIVWEITEITSAGTVLNINHINLSVPLPGKHNAENFVVAFAAALALGCTPENIIDGFKHFSQPPQRSKMFTFADQTILFDDTYNASPESVKAALKMLYLPEWKHKKKILILGDMLELGDESKFWHENLFPHLKELYDTHLCLFGPAMYNCYRLFKEMDKNALHAQQLNVEWLDSTRDPGEFLTTMPTIRGAVILVKGSRGMRLERFVHCVENFFS